jgi:hypothetical protein
MKIMAVASLIIAILAIIVAIVSAVYTGMQVQIERDRRHEELTPDLKVDCISKDHDANQVELTVELVGPPGLDGLDEVTVRVRDDMPDRKPRPGSQLTKEQISEVIWGPYRIRAGLRDTDETGRTHGPFRLPKNEPYPVPLERSYPPSWTEPQRWRADYFGMPVRIEIICARDGYKPWTIPAEVPVTSPPFFVA